MVAVAMGKKIELSLQEALERIPKRLTRMRSHSFYRYFHHLKMLDWVEPTGEEEKSSMGGIPGWKYSERQQPKFNRSTSAEAILQINSEG